MVATDLAKLNSDQEWMVSNPHGGSSYGTPERLPRRRYHGLLCARAPYFDKPHHILAEVNEVIQTGSGEGFELAAFDYEVGIHPRGFTHLDRFEATAEAVLWEYRLGQARLKRTLRLLPGKLAVQLDYEGEGFSDGSFMQLFPYFSCRGLHELQEENAILDGRVQRDGDKYLVKFYKYFPELMLWMSGAPAFSLQGFWNLKVCYAEEKRRGYWHKEDLFCPGSFEIALSGSFHHSLVIGVSDAFDQVDPLPRWSPTPLVLAKPKTRSRRKVSTGTPDETPLQGTNLLRTRLEHALLALRYQPTDDFNTLLAGFPWFEVQTRDLLVAFRGLLYSSKGLELGAQILDTLQERLEHGLLPSQLVLESLGAEGGHELDASLLMIRAIQLYEQKAGLDAIHPWEECVFEILTAILEHKVKGIHVRPSGLLYASSKPQPKTWMNAMVAGTAVTPRSPFAVEQNALFHQAVNYAIQLGKRLNRPAFLEVWEAIAARLQETFLEAFWLEEDGFLADAHDGVLPVEELRPNQLWALASPCPMLNREQGTRILALVREHLLTPKGLRSLEPGVPGYLSGPYGSAQERERAWHQGAVWPWLLGIYIDAVAFVEGRDAARAQAKELLENLAPELERGLSGHLPECFSAEPPHLPMGAPSRLWNLGELLYLCNY